MRTSGQEIRLSRKGCFFGQIKKPNAVRLRERPIDRRGRRAKGKGAWGWSQGMSRTCGVKRSGSFPLNVPTRVRQGASERDRSIAESIPAFSQAAEGANNREKARIAHELHAKMPSLRHGTDRVQQFEQARGGNRGKDSFGFKCHPRKSPPDIPAGIAGYCVELKPAG
jgi:hypothetical protein